MTDPQITPASISTLLLPIGSLGTFDITIGPPAPGRMVVIAYTGNDVGSTLNEVFTVEVILGGARLTNGLVRRQGARITAREGSGQTTVEVFGIKNADLPNVAGTYQITLQTNFGVIRFMGIAFEVTGCPSEQFSDFNGVADNTDIPAPNQWSIGLLPTVSQSLLVFFTSFNITNQPGGPVPVLQTLENPIAEILPNQVGCSAASQIGKGCPQQFFMSFSLDQDTYGRANVILSFQGGVTAPTVSAGGPYSGIAFTPIQLTSAIVDGTHITPPRLWTIFSGGTGTFDIDTDFNPTFTPDQVGPYVLRLTVTPCEGPAVISDTNLTSLDIPPTVDAGGPYAGEVNIATAIAATVVPGTDPAPTDFWTIVSGGTGTFADAGAPSTSFTPSQVSTYVLRFTAAPNDGPIVFDETAFTSNAPPTIAPIVDAGGPYSGLVGQTQGLFTATVDVGSDPAPVLLWEIVSGGSGFFTNPSLPFTAFLPNQVGPYVLRLTATPNDGPPVSDIANFDSQSIAPVANAGPDVQGQQGTPIQMNGSIIFGTDPAPTYLWTVVFGGTGIISNPIDFITNFTPDQVGPYTLRFTITPNDGPPVFDEANVISDPRAPSVDAGGPYLGIVNTPIALNATFGVGSDPVPIGLWEIVSGGSGTFSDATNPQATFTPDVVEKYVLRFTLDPVDGPIVGDTASLDSRQVVQTASKQHNDLKMAALGGPTLGDGFLTFLLANGATSQNTNDATMEFLFARGVSPGRKNDMWVAFLTNIPSLPLTGHISEMKRRWWASGAPLT